MNQLSPITLIAIIFVAFFLAAVIIFYYCITRSNQDTNQQHLPQYLGNNHHHHTTNNHKTIIDTTIQNGLKISTDNPNEGDTSMQRTSSFSGSSTLLSEQLPFRSSSNMTLVSFSKTQTRSGKTRRKTCEIISRLRLNTIKWMAVTRVGTGGFSEVFHIVDETSKKSLAMKWIRIEQSVAKRRSSQALFKTFHFESELLSKLEHDNIITYFGRSIADNEMIIYLELAACGNLVNFISIYGKLHEYLIRRFSKDVLSALNYLHSLKIVHRDIKCTNLLVMNDGKIKVSDFGASCRLNETSYEQLDTQGTYNWMAPEMISFTKEKPYGTKVDIWSFGCCIIEMASGLSPWIETNKTEWALMYHIATYNKLPKLPESLSETAREFVLGHLVREAANRCTASELLGHTFLNHVPERDKVELKFI